MRKNRVRTHEAVILHCGASGARTYSPDTLVLNQTVRYAKQSAQVEGYAVEASELSFLVVEDETSQRETLLAMLATFKPGAVHAAADGQEALDVLIKHRTPVDVIVCDIKMPVMDGLEFIRHLGNSGYDGSVIIVSGLEHSLMTSAQAMTKAYGVDLLGAISKPVTVAGLQNLLSRRGGTGPRREAEAAAPPSFLLDEILEGLQQNQFEPFFQPKVDIATRKVIGAEALARWRHPQQGVVAPSAFIKTLEDAGKIDELLWVMLRKGAAVCRTLQTSGSDSSVSVNVSLTSLNNVEFSNRVIQVVRGQNVSTDKMCLEITEMAATTNLGLALENLTRLRMLGFGVSIRDFGTGYSSIQHLTRIPFTELKIDRSLVTNSSREESAKVILRSSLHTARELSVKAVAEGVETQQDWDLLQELGCDQAQGYFIETPMDATAYVTWIRDLATNATSMFVA